MVQKKRHQREQLADVIITVGFFVAEWQNGDAEDCKSLNIGSIPVSAFPFVLICLNGLAAVEVAVRTKVTR